MVSPSPPLGRGCNRSHISHPMAQRSTRRNQMIFAVFKGKQKCGLRYVKTAIFCTCGSNNWETVEDRWVHALRGLASTKLSFHSCNVLRDCHRGVPRARWLSGRASDLRSSSRGFEARPRRCCATTLGKLFTPYCLCHQAV